METLIKKNLTCGACQNKFNPTYEEVDGYYRVVCPTCSCIMGFDMEYYE